MDLEEMLDLRAVVITLLLGAVVIGMIWNLAFWDSYPFAKKVLISVLSPIAIYFVTLFTLNRD